MAANHADTDAMTRAHAATRAKRARTRPADSGAAGRPDAPGRDAAAAAPAPACPATVRVRPACPADVSRVGAQWLELSRAQEQAGAEWLLADEAADRIGRAAQAAPSNPRTLCLVADVEEAGALRPAGFLHATVKTRSPIYRDSVVGEIAAVHVEKEFSGRQVEFALIRAALDWFAKRGIGQVEATLPSALDAAREPFLATGFRESASVLRAEIVPAAAETAPPSPA